MYLHASLCGWQPFRTVASFSLYACALVNWYSFVLLIVMCMPVGHVSFFVCSIQNSMDFMIPLIITCAAFWFCIVMLMQSLLGPLPLVCGDAYVTAVR